MALASGSIVLLHLVSPSEKYWGVLERIDSTGVTLRGIGVESFDAWAREVAGDEPPSLGLATMFVPLFRVERVYLDEQVGQVESYGQRFERLVGMEVESFLGAAAKPLEAPS